MFYVPLSINSEKVWTGLNSNFTSSPHDNCDGWRSGNDSHKSSDRAIIGSAKYKGTNNICSYATASCGSYNKDIGTQGGQHCTVSGGCSERHLYCVQQ